MILAFPVVVQEISLSPNPCCIYQRKACVISKVRIDTSQNQKFIGNPRKNRRWTSSCSWLSCKKIKDLTTDIEETHPVGRLFDLDVIDINGQKLSRPSFRKCIICGCQAQECARTRKHSVNEMQSKIEEMLMEFDCQKKRIVHRRSNFKMYIHVYININTYIYLESHKKASQH